MASIDDIVKVLKKGIRFGAVGRVSSKQIDEAAEQILSTGTVSWDVLDQIGRELAGDYLLFNDVDVGHLEDVLRKKNRGAVEENELST